MSISSTVPVRPQSQRRLATPLAAATGYGGECLLCGPLTSEREDMVGVNENVAAVRDFIERAWNNGDESVFEEHLSADFPFPGGREGFKQMIFKYREASWGSTWRCMTSSGPVTMSSPC